MVPTTFHSLNSSSTLGLSSPLNSLRMLKSKHKLTRQRHKWIYWNSSSTVEMLIGESHREVNAAGSLNTHLWGCKFWNITEKNLQQLWSFHYFAIRIHSTIGIKWNQVQEQWITNKEVWMQFNIIHNLGNKRYVEKVFRSKNKAIPTKLLGASMDPLPQKIGCSQNSCKSNFLEAVQSNTPEVNKNSGWL